MSIRFFWWVLVLILVVVCAAGLAACSGDGPKAGLDGQSAPPSRLQAAGTPAVEVPPQPAGTVTMARLLVEIAARRAPLADPRANRERLAYYLRTPQPAEPRQQLVRRFNIAIELLRVGRTEEALEAFDTLLAEPAGGPALNRLYLLELKAVSELRLGAERTRETVWNLLPMPAAEDPAAAAGARAAIVTYNRILELRPDDLRSRWLLNMAAMRAGSWPGGVGDRWRIGPERLRPTSPPAVGPQSSGRRATRPEFPPFPDVAPALGIDLLGLSGGAVLDDFDGDGRLDLWASSSGAHHQLRYFRNTGAAGFEELTTAAGLDGLIGGLNLLQADYDNDGDRDLLVLRGAWLRSEPNVPNSLLRNDGGNHFTDVTAAAGLLTLHPTQTAAWGDYNNDGRLDLFIGNETSPEGLHPCELFLNNGDGTFRDVAAAAGVAVEAFVKSLAWGDYDNDGRLDLYLSVLSGDNLLFHNIGPDADGTWRFEEVGEQAGVREPFKGFPTWFWDYDNDGRLDLFVSGFSGSRSALAAEDVAAFYLGLPYPAERPRLFHNQGDGTFIDVAEAAGLARPLYTMGSNFGDIDNDGRLDIYLGTGAPDLRAPVPNTMFRNAGADADGIWRFEDVTVAGGFGHLGKGHAIAFGDFDEDGDQDIYEVMGGAMEADISPNVLYLNPGFGNRWIKLRLIGRRSNRDAFGARIKVVVERPEGVVEIHRTVSTGGPFGGSPLRAEIGLGDATAVRRIEITWPATGETQILEDVEMNRLHEIVEHPAAEARR